MMPNEVGRSDVLYGPADTRQIHASLDLYNGNLLCVDYIRAMSEISPCLVHGPIVVIAVGGLFDGYSRLG